MYIFEKSSNMFILTKIRLVVDSLELLKVDTIQVDSVLIDLSVL